VVTIPKPSRASIAPDAIVQFTLPSGPPSNWVIGGTRGKPVGRSHSGRVAPLETVQARGRPHLRREQPVQGRNLAAAHERQGALQRVSYFQQQLLQRVLDEHRIGGRRNLEQRSVHVEKEAPRGVVGDRRQRYLQAAARTSMRKSRRCTAGGRREKWSQH
jgi:hypothetical protein